MLLKPHWANEMPSDGKKLIMDGETSSFCVSNEDEEDNTDSSEDESNHTDNQILGETEFDDDRHMAAEFDDDNLGNCRCREFQSGIVFVKKQSSREQPSSTIGTLARRWVWLRMVRSLPKPKSGSHFCVKQA